MNDQEIMAHIAQQELKAERDAQRAEEEEARDTLDALWAVADAAQALVFYAACDTEGRCIYCNGLDLVHAGDCEWERLREALAALAPREEA